MSALTPRGSRISFSSAGTTPVVSAVEDLYRDQVSAAETGDEAGAVSSASAEERTSWARIAKGAQLIRAQMHPEARLQFEEALQHAGYGDKASEAETAKLTACLAALYELGKLLCETGEYDGALQQFEEAMRFAPPYVHLQIRLQVAARPRHCTPPPAIHLIAPALFTPALFTPALFTPPLFTPPLFTPPHPPRPTHPPHPARPPFTPRPPRARGSAPGAPGGWAGQSKRGPSTN